VISCNLQFKATGKDASFLVRLPDGKGQGGCGGHSNMMVLWRQRSRRLRGRLVMSITPRSYSTIVDNPYLSFD
jgi:hypothetical protein